MLSMGFSLSVLRPWVTWVTSASLVCLGLSITGCTSGDIVAGHGVQTPPPSSALSAGKVDDLLVVDCLLPGRLQTLGQHFIYLTPRQPVKTTVQDCEIRGGE